MRECKRKKGVNLLVCACECVCVRLIDREREKCFTKTSFKTSNFSLALNREHIIAQSIPFL